MKVLLINGSPRAKGNTCTALSEMAAVLQAEGIDTEIVQVGGKVIRGCIGCGGCNKGAGCVFDDEVNQTAKKFEECDGLVIGSPVYYASVNGTLSAFCDRLFYSTRFNKSMKVGAAVVAARRGGLSASFDQINKYFTISGMPVASGSYWNSVHGSAPGECVKDEEGMQTVRNTARNMAFLIKSIALGKEKYGLPERESTFRTNFIR